MSIEKCEESSSLQQKINVGYFSQVYYEMNNQIQTGNEPQKGSDSQIKSLTDLMSMVILTPSQMLTLVSDDYKFTEKIIQYNEIGVHHIDNENYSEALIYLQEAEKLLEYGASCGKTIDRVLITSTLQNQACAYQRVWELQKSCNYMEAILYNMNSYIDNGSQIETFSENCYSDPEFYDMISLFVGKRLSVAFHYLQFSAVSSQTKKHQTALTNAFKALETLKVICSYCYRYQEYSREENEENEVLVINSMLKVLANANEDLKVEQLEKNLRQTKKFLQKMKQRVHKKAREERVNPVLSEFTIGDVMQICCISIKDLKKKNELKEQISFTNKMLKVFYVSICYFAIATELRLLANEKNLEEEEKRNSIEYKKSQIYHLQSIYLVAMFLPCQSLYLEHILRSFKNHYNAQLFEPLSEMEQNENHEVHVQMGKSSSPATSLEVNKIRGLHRKTQTFTSEKCLQNIKITLKKKKKRNSVFNQHLLGKKDLKNVIRQEKVKSGIKINEKYDSKTKRKAHSIHQTPQSRVRRKSQRSEEKYDNEFETTKNQVNGHKNKNQTLKFHSEEKSKSKSKSSKKLFKHMKEGLKQKNEGKKKKNARLQEEYFFQSDKKKRKNKGGKSGNKIEANEYGRNEVQTNLFNHKTKMRKKQ